MRNTTKAGRNVKNITGTPNEHMEAWPHPDEGAFSPNIRAMYSNRKKGVLLYLDGNSQSIIFKESGLKINQVHRLIVNRCLAPHPDGRIYGWRGLVPQIRIRPYKRKRKVRVDNQGRGAAGALQLMFDMHADLRDRFVKRILKSACSSQLGPTKIPRQSHWKWFLDELRLLGYEARNEWPFNTLSMGYYSVSRYVDSVLKGNPTKALRVIGGPELERKGTSGDGVDRPISRIFERVEMDAHKLDGMFCVLLPQSAGGYVPKVIHRIWIIVIIEIVSKAVLGYYLSLRLEVNKEDVLRTIKRALSVWRPLETTFSKEAYKEGAGFPSSIDDALLGVCWNETSVDGALAETCYHVNESLKNVVGSTLISPTNSFARRRSKDDRPFIEAFFKNLASRGLHRLSNTTGGKAGGANGRKPAEVAANSAVQIEYIEELLDVLIANYNATPHTSLGYRSPLQYLKMMVDKKDFPFRYADPNAIQALMSYRKKCRVLGGVKVGKRPYVNFEGARYSSEIMAQREDLVGSYIWVVNHLEDDARIAMAFMLNGMHLGVIRAAPPWHRLPHSLDVRRAINSCIHNRSIFIASGTDPIAEFIGFCEECRNHKLPVHPAYLKIRRILAHEAVTEEHSIKEETFKDASKGRSLAKPPSPELTASEIKVDIPARRKAIVHPGR